MARPAAPQPSSRATASQAPALSRGAVALRHALHFYWRLVRPMTLGVRAALIDPERGVFLVRHGYTPGWHMPGGGGEAGETLAEAMAREVREEGNISIDGALSLHGIFFNRGISRRDHVAVYVVRTFTQTGPRPPDREIVETGFFRMDALPSGITRGTRERLEEIHGERPLSPYW